MTGTLPARYQDWAEDLVEVVAEVGASDEFILKSRVLALEQAIAQRVGRHAVGCANGTGALVLALTGLGVGPGDEVITPAFSFVSSASGIVLAGARPVFVDVDPETVALDPAAAAAAVTGRTRALLPAHLFSQVAPMPALRALADRHGLALVEDSAVALGSTVAGRPAGTWGEVGVFSFFPAKPLGGIGDGGMLVTDDGDLAGRLRALRNHGQFERFRHDLVGFNCRMDEIVAGFLLRQLPRLDQLRAARRRLADHYAAALAPLAPAVRTIPHGPPDQGVYTYVVRVRDRDGLRAYLAAEGIATAVTYPRALPAQPAFAGYSGDGPPGGAFPVATRLAEECLALPLYPELGPADVDRVVAAVAAYYRSQW